MLLRTTYQLLAWSVNQPQRLGAPPHLGAAPHNLSTFGLVNQTKPQQASPPAQRNPRYIAQPSSALRTTVVQPPVTATQQTVGPKRGLSTSPAQSEFLSSLPSLPSYYHLVISTSPSHSSFGLLTTNINIKNTTNIRFGINGIRIFRDSGDTPKLAYEVPLRQLNRAVDDKATKNLLGPTFRRQLKYDGTCSAVTFICSKTGKWYVLHRDIHMTDIFIDDISNTEAADSLGLGDGFEDLEDQLQTINHTRRAEATENSYIGS